MADAVQAQASCNAENGEKVKALNRCFGFSQSAGGLLVAIKTLLYTSALSGGRTRRTTTTTTRWRERGDDEANAASNIKISQ